MRSHLSTTRRATLRTAAFLATAALVLTACGRSSGDADETSSSSGGTDESSSAAVAEGAATGTIELWTQGADGAQLPEMFAKFQEENPDAQLNMTEIPSEEFESKMTAAIAAGTVPDLVYIFTENQASLLATKAFDPVPDGLVNESDFFENMWSVSVLDGTAYGVPWYAYARGSYYRTDLAGDAQLPTDWASVETFAQTMKDQGVEYPVSLSVTWDQYTAWQLGTFATANGGGLVAEDLSAWTIDTPENVAALEFWAGLIQKGYASADGPAFLDTVPWLTGGTNAGILDGGPWFWQWFIDAQGEDWVTSNLTYVPNPAGPNGGTGASAGGGSWFVPTEGEDKDAAWKFVQFMSEPSSQVEWFQIFGNMPTVIAAWDDPVLQEGPVLETVRTALESAVTTPPVPTWPEVGAMLGREMEKVARGTATAQEVLTTAQAQADTIGMGN